MPIKPENKALYPENWETLIRPEILKRANNCCEFCKIENYSEVKRGQYEYMPDPMFVSTKHSYPIYQKTDGSVFCANTGMQITSPHELKTSAKAVKIVLTIAHLDHDPTNNDYSNLRALCQLCHNRYDAEHRKANRAATNLAKKLPNQNSLF